MAERNRRYWVCAALGVACLAGALLWWGSTDKTAGSPLPATERATVATALAASATAHLADRDAGVQAQRRPGKLAITPEVEHLRARVLQSLASREGARPAPASANAAGERTPGALIDRTGELDPQTMRVLNDELMPMVEQCYEQARERKPSLQGLLAVGLDFAGADDLGTIVEAVEPVKGTNELADDELLDCVRQSAFTIQLPMPIESGRVSRELTMRFGGTEAR